MPINHSLDILLVYISGTLMNFNEIRVGVDFRSIIEYLSIHFPRALALDSIMHCRLDCPRHQMRDI